MIKRINTGITDKKGKLALDELMGGGIPIGNSVLVTGASGTGKSTFCYQVTQQQAKEGKICYYVAFDQTKEDVIENAKAVGINLNHKNIFIQTYNELQDLVIDELIELIKESEVDFLVLDSIASISGILPEAEFAKISQAKINQNYMPMMASESRVIRKAIRRIVLALKEHKITSLLINELPEGTKKLSKDDESDFLADGVIVMYYLPIGEDETNAFRSMRIRKMRKTNHEKGIILYSLTNKGIILAEDPMKKF